VIWEVLQMIKAISQKYQNKEVVTTKVLWKEETNLNKSLIVRLDLCLVRIKECNVRLIYNIQGFFPHSVTIFLI
jgi:hypothetical protein